MRVFPLALVGFVVATHGTLSGCGSMTQTTYEKVVEVVRRSAGGDVEVVGTLDIHSDKLLEFWQDATSPSGAFMPRYAVVVFLHLTPVNGESSVLVPVYDAGAGRLALNYDDRTVVLTQEHSAELRRSISQLRPALQDESETHP